MVAPCAVSEHTDVRGIFSMGCGRVLEKEGSSLLPSTGTLCTVFGIPLEWSLPAISPTLRFTILLSVQLEDGVDVPWGAALAVEVAEYLSLMSLPLLLMLWLPLLPVGKAAFLDSWRAESALDSSRTRRTVQRLEGRAWCWDLRSVCGISVGEGWSWCWEEIKEDEDEDEDE